MKVLIVNSMTPFIRGNTDALAVNLQKNLIATGHEAEILRIPFQAEPLTGIPSQILLVRTFELWNVDRVIALQFPAAYIRHPHKTLWLLDQYRPAYDLIESSQANLDLELLVRSADSHALSESKQVYTNSQVTLQRLKKYNDFTAQVLPSPLNDPELFSNKPEQGYIFSSGRISAMTRPHLLIEAMRYVRSDVKLVIAGLPDSLEDVERLKQAVHEYGVVDRVRLDLRPLPREAHAEYVNQSMAVVCLASDEDSLTSASMEAAAAGKALITTLDCEDTLGLAKHMHTGWVVDATSQSIALAMKEATENAELTRSLGLNAHSVWSSFRATWPATIKALTQ